MLILIVIVCCFSIDQNQLGEYCLVYVDNERTKSMFIVLLLLYVVWNWDTTDICRKEHSRHHTKYYEPVRETLVANQSAQSRPDYVPCLS